MERFLIRIIVLVNHFPFININWRYFLNIINSYIFFSRDNVKKYLRFYDFWRFRAYSCQLCLQNPRSRGAMHHVPRSSSLSSAISAFRGNERIPLDIPGSKGTLVEVLSTRYIVLFPGVLGSHFIGPECMKGCENLTQPGAELATGSAAHEHADHYGTAFPRKSVTVTNFSNECLYLNFKLFLVYYFYANYSF